MSRVDRFTPVANKKELFSDFLNDLAPHPDRHDLARYTNENAIKRSIKNLLLTNKYERFFNPNIGSDINKLLFENISPEVTYALKERISNVIKTYEPRCRLTFVDVKPSENENGYYITIEFETINTISPATLQFSLNRTQ